MPTILASAIIDKAEIILQDTVNTRWAASEHLGWLNDGQREIAGIKPDACTVTKAVQLVAGSKQTLGSGSTSDAVMLQKVTRNMGTTGTDPGNAIRVVPGEVLDSFRPGWHADSQTTNVQNLVFDPRSPRQFYVYPPSDGTGYVEVMYSATPAALTATTDVITVNDTFASALIDYILYRAYSKDTEYPGNGERALAYRAAFEAALGVRSANILANNPNLERTGFAPDLPGAAS